MREFRYCAILLYARHHMTLDMTYALMSRAGWPYAIFLI